MARTDVIVLGGGIVGTSIALHLAKRSLSVALIDRAGIGEQTSYGNAGIIEGNTIFPPAFPSDPGVLMRIALKQAGEANYHLSYLPKAAPWLFAFWQASQPARLVEHAHLIRPLFSHAIAEHETLLAESGAAHFLRKTGWLKLYRGGRGYAALKPELDLAGEFGIPIELLNPEEARELEPSLAPVFEHAVFWPQAASISNPLGVTLAYAERFRALGGVTVAGDARTLHRSGDRWRVETDEGGVDAGDVVVALGPWAPDLLTRFGVNLPMLVKRGYHRQYHARGKAKLSRPIFDAAGGYILTPMEAGLRITTGVEFAPRDAKPTPVQFDRLLPRARQLFPLGEQIDDTTWMGARPCFADSRPVIGRAPGIRGLWLAIGHAHWGLTLGPATGRMIAEMMTGNAPFCDPAPYSVERFS